MTGCARVLEEGLSQQKCVYPLRIRRGDIPDNTALINKFDSLKNREPPPEEVKKFVRRRRFPNFSSISGSVVDQFEDAHRLGEKPPDFPGKRPRHLNISCGYFPLDGSREDVQSNESSNHKRNDCHQDEVRRECLFERKTKMHALLQSLEAPVPDGQDKLISLGIAEAIQPEIAEKSMHRFKDGTISVSGVGAFDYSNKSAWIYGINGTYQQNENFSVLSWRLTAPLRHRTIWQHGMLAIFSRHDREEYGGGCEA